MRTILNLGLLSCLTVYGFSQSAPSRVDQSHKANLEILLEGPAAVCRSAQGNKDNLVVLMPAAQGHFSPGIDTDLSQTLLCQGDYLLDVGRRKAGKAKERAVTGITIDELENSCTPDSSKYLSITMISPDEIIPTAPSEIVGPILGGNRFASKLLLRYKDVDLNSFRLSRQDKALSCLVQKVIGTTDTSTNSSLNNSTTVALPWTPRFVSLPEVRIVLSMQPIDVQNLGAAHVQAAYGATLKMLGIGSGENSNSPKEFHELAHMGMLGPPHGDCLPPQILVHPKNDSSQK